VATVTGLTAERMLAIEAQSIVDGNVDAEGNLFLIRYDGQTIAAGTVIGPNAASKAYVDDITKGGTQDLKVKSLKITATNDVSATSTSPPFQIGDDSGANMVIDGNEIVPRNNGVGKKLYLEYGANSSTSAYTPTDPGDFSTKGYADANLASAKTYADSKVASAIASTELGTGVNLNTIVTPGVYTQGSTAEAVAGTNYPSSATQGVVAGLLEVFVASSTMMWQRYTPYGQYGDRVYIRGYYSGTWQPWKTLYTADIWDTGWITSGLSFGVASGYAIESYQLRKVGSQVKGQVNVTYSGTTLTTDAGGNLADKNNVLTMPSGWRNTSKAWALINIWVSGLPNWVGRAYNDGTGTIDLVAGSSTGQSLTSGTVLRFVIDYFID